MFWAMYQCVLNETLWNDWSKVTYAQVHGSPVLKTLSFKNLNWISVTIFAELVQFGQGPKLWRPRPFWRENLVFHWRKISYFNFVCMYVCIYMYICIYVYIFIYTYIIHIYTYIFIYTHTHICMFIYLFISNLFTVDNFR